MSNDYIELHDKGSTEPLNREPAAAKVLRLQSKDGKIYGQKRGGTALPLLDVTKSIDNIPASDFVEFAITKTATTGGATDCTVTVNMSNPDGTAKTAAGAMLRGRICSNGLFPVTSSATTTIAAGTGCTLVDTHTANKDITITNVADATATGTLTITTAVDGNTVTIGSRVYQLWTGETAMSGSNVKADISGGGVKAQGTLTIAEPLTAGDTIVIGDQTYVFVTGTANAPGEIGIGANEAATKVNIPAAINGTDSINTANTKVSAAAAFSSDTLTLTARYTGTQGNSIVTAELGQGLTHASNVFDAATLGTTTAGVAVTAAQACTALVTAINADSSAIVSAAEGAGDTVDITADTAGADGNLIATTDTLSNGAFGAATLTGGATGNESQFIFTITNSADETLTFRIGPPVIGQPVHGDYGATLQMTWSA